MTTVLTFKHNVIPQSEYGAKELKQYIEVATYRAFMLTIALIVLGFIIFLSFFAFKAFTNDKGYFPPPTTIIGDVSLQRPTIIPSTNIIPPSTNNIAMNSKYCAGIFIPISDKLLYYDLPEVASTDKMGFSTSIGGGKDNTLMLNNNTKVVEQIPINITKKEEEIDPWGFVSVEKDPYTDYEDLLKRVEYPPFAKLMGKEGKVIVRVLVGKDGNPKKYLVDYSDGDILVPSAVKAIMSSVFTPAIQNGQPIAVWVSIPITFKLK